MNINISARGVKFQKIHETNSEKIGGRRLVRQWFSARSGRLSFFPRN